MLKKHLNGFKLKFYSNLNMHGLLNYPNFGFKLKNIFKGKEKENSTEPVKSEIVSKRLDKPTKDMKKVKKNDLREFTINLAESDLYNEIYVKESINVNEVENTSDDVNQSNQSTLPSKPYYL